MCFGIKLADASLLSREREAGSLKRSYLDRLFEQSHLKILLRQNLLKIEKTTHQTTNAFVTAQSVTHLPLLRLGSKLRRRGGA